MERRQIKNILIANRGEFALRVIRACKELEICSVSVFSDVDRKSLHVLQADEAYGLGGSMPRESYLNQARVIEISRAGLLVLTAMKTENEICSRTNGRVMTIHVEKGKTVETGEPLVAIAEH